MLSTDHTEYDDGVLRGRITDGYAEELGQSLSDLKTRLAAPEARLIASGRNQSVLVSFEGATRPVDVLVKCFGSQSAFKDLRDSRRGSKAERSFAAAHHLLAHEVGTPVPIAFLERWQGTRLMESYYLSAYQKDAVGFGDQLLKLYHEIQEVEPFVETLRTVAKGASRMHDAGFLHNDLGNQNILLVGAGQSFSTIDLNRGRILPGLSLRQRARDLSRLAIPSGMTELFLDMYWQGTTPKALTQWLRRYRRLFSLHAASRKWRHPVREARIAQEEADTPPEQRYPDPKEIWIWDSRTEQAFGALDRKERIARYPRSRSLPMLKETLKSALAIRRAYLDVDKAAFQPGVDLSARIAMSLEPVEGKTDEQLALLGALGTLPVLVRLYHHKGEHDLNFRKAFIRQLQAAGHSVSIALVQDRQAVREPVSWGAFVRDAVVDLEQLDFVEVGHAINRVKWGIWGFDELARLYEPLIGLQKQRPDLRFTGPAGIDFEYPFVIAALRCWPDEVPLHALSHHLYVDRRGAPENLQGSFNAVDKFALARAIAHQSGRTGGFMVTGVNWPLADTGPWSPIASPQLQMGDDVGGESEEVYASFMLRYLALAAFSGFVDRVYWWHLVARGFGLIDNSDSETWRQRPAYFALQHLVALFEGATSVSAEIPEAEDRHGLYRFEWQRAEGERVMMVYAHGAPIAMPEVAASHCEDQCGNRIATPQQVTGSPIYLRGVVG